MMNSSRPSSLAVTFAIENDLLSSVPGMPMSTYWPGKKRNSSASAGSSSTRWRMSCVTLSLATTVVTALWIGSPDRIISSS